MTEQTITSGPGTTEAWTAVALSFAGALCLAWVAFFETDAIIRIFAAIGTAAGLTLVGFLAVAVRHQRLG